MNKTRLYILLSILPFLAFITNVKAYDLSGISKATRIDYGLYYDTTLVTSPLPSCTSANEYDCYITDVSLPNAINTCNNFRIVVRDNMNTNFSVGTQYKISMYFEQETAGYWFSSSRITQVTGNTYRNFTNWTTDDITITSYNLSLIDSEDGMYRFDVVFVPSTTQVAGFNFRIWQDYETVSNNNNNYIRMWRNVSISQLSPGQIDYTQNFDNVIDNQNQNTQDIIDNQNQNAQDIINNQNENSRVCNKKINWSNVLTTGEILNINGSIGSGAASYGITDYIPIDKGIKVTKVYNYWVATCFYSQDKTLNSCIASSSMVLDSFLTIPNNAYYVRFTVNRTNGPEFLICTSGNQAINDSLTDDDVSGANSSASNFFSSFTTETYGLTSVITSPLTFIQSLTSKTCSSLVLPLPYVNRNLELPCMRSIYEQHFGGFLSIYQTITFGIISYWVVVRIFNLVKDFKNPDHDEIEVMDL